MDVSAAKPLKALEDENARLKKLLADRMLEASAPRELLLKKCSATVKREAVAHPQAVIGLSERRACWSVGPCRSVSQCGTVMSNLSTAAGTTNW
jgi:hypothetical protein